MTGASLLVRGIGRLVTNDPDLPGPLGVIEDAAILVSAGRVEWVGRRTELPPGDDRLELDVDGRTVVPGFVDAHTHLIFAGSRADEFGRRLRGESYEEIMAAGGGIRSTVRATRAASAEDLTVDAARRLNRMLATGTTTAEVKSGYGLDVATETKIFDVMQRLDVESPLDVVPTFLGAHTIPEEFESDRDRYLQLLEDEMLPACAPRARFCDVFCDDGAFTIEEARRVLEAGMGHGLIPRLHADQLTPSGGAALAADLGAASADHLDHITPEEVSALAEAGTTAVLLPGVSLSLRTPFPDPGPLLDAGVTVAIATDANPGTSYVLTMPFVVALACLEMGMTTEQALWSATRGGAISLQLPDRGWVRRDAAADLVVLDAESHVDLAYRPDSDLVRTVVKGGVVAAGLG
jgi:imidazolonepropionase